MTTVFIVSTADACEYVPLAAYTTEQSAQAAAAFIHANITPIQLDIPE